MFQVLKVKNFLPRHTYLAKVSFKIDFEIKYFHDNEQFKNFMAIKPALNFFQGYTIKKEKNQIMPKIEYDKYI